MISLRECGQTGEEVGTGVSGWRPRLASLIAISQPEYLAPVRGQLCRGTYSSYFPEDISLVVGLRRVPLSERFRSTADADVN